MGKRIESGCISNVGPNRHFSYVHSRSTLPRTRSARRRSELHRPQCEMKSRGSVGSAVSAWVRRTETCRGAPFHACQTSLARKAGTAEARGVYRLRVVRPLLAQPCHRGKRSWRWRWTHGPRCGGVVNERGTMLLRTAMESGEVTGRWGTAAE
jgi:hypothetical protein